MLYYLNGTYSETAPMVSVDDRRFTLGDSCFTTLKIEHAEPKYLTDHLNRLQHHLGILYIPLALDYNHYHHIIKTMVQKTGIDHGVMRITLSRGIQTIRGLIPSQETTPNILISLSPTPMEQNQDILTAYISPIKRNHTSPLSQMKSTSSYLDNIIAMKHAKDHECSEVLFLNLKDEACCFSIGNLLVETHNNKWLSPPPESGCIQGITLKYLPYDIDYQVITLDMLKAAKNIYRTNSISGMVRVEIRF